MTNTFDTFNLRAELLQAVQESGYETPTPIQSSAIPALLEGRDVLGQAQTGTGKTATFVLPMLQSLDRTQPGIHGLILTPTRELAIQVSEATFRYGRHLNVRVLPVYGGQSYARQIKRLQGGVDVVVGTPGRTLDLIKQGMLNLHHIRFLVLDEADEMLSMGFIEDVETILSQTPAARQTALFSATLPAPIQQLAERYMCDPLTITVARKALTVPQTEQRYYLLQEPSKLAALSRLLEVEEVTSALIFTRTKIGAAQLADDLLARGFTAEALHGDLSQEVRETVLRRFRSGRVSILVATDVVARGIDIQGVSHVINFDIPNDAEDYVHRIGRTGRAGRTGIAITLVTPRERRWLKAIEAFIKQPITRATLPVTADVIARRDARFAARLSETITASEFNTELALINELVNSGRDLTEVAAAAIRLARAHESQRPVEEVQEVHERPDYGERDPRRQRLDTTRRDRDRHGYETGMVRLLLNVGHEHGIRPGDVVGAIASEAGIPGRAIGAIDIRKRETFVDVSEAHVERVLRQMKRSKLRGQPITLARAGHHPADSYPRRERRFPPDARKPLKA